MRFCITSVSCIENASQQKDVNTEENPVIQNDRVREFFSNLPKLISCFHGDIFRGEPECFDKVSSTLFRSLYEIEDEDLLKNAEKDRIRRSKPYIGNFSDDEVLARLQHAGAKTNFIDFTKDIYIALFFCCLDSHDKTGRIILFRGMDISFW